MTWDLPLSVFIDGEEYEIESQCDWRVILDILVLYEDPNIELFAKHSLAMVMFYKEPKKLKNPQAAVYEMVRIVDGKKPEEVKETGRTEDPLRLMSWSKDFHLIAPAVSSVLGYDIRTPGKYTHWWTFLGAWMSLKESTWQCFVEIRKKRLKGENLEKWEERVYRENKNEIDLPAVLTEEEEDYLFGEGG